MSDARQRTLDLVADLSGTQLFGPRLATVNPLQWELGHIAWFQERWISRHALGGDSLVGSSDALYDSSAVAHDVRWDLPLLSRTETLDYLRRSLERSLAQLPALQAEGRSYFAELAVFHEDMHAEAILYTRQTLGYPRPAALPDRTAHLVAGPLQGDASVPGGTFELGAPRDGTDFIFDNEKWRHPVELQPFRIARAPVTQAEFAEFIDAGGYRTQTLWSEDGWRWRCSVAADAPVYWRRREGRWERRDFDQWVALEPHRPVVHVCLHEAEAFARWAGRRLPSEAEWEAAAVGSAAPGGGLAAHRRAFPWREQPPSTAFANLDGSHGGCVDVAALPDGEGAFGCRQMIGNVWEWTSTVFDRFEGFSADPYRDYSEPWFGDHFVLKGGAWMTRARMIRPGYRNFYKADRRDVWAGFRTCAQ